MSADFYFGMIVGMVVVLVSLVGLLVWSKSRGDSLAERSLEQLRLRNQLDESKLAVLKQINGQLAAAVHALDPVDLVKDSPPSEGLAACAVVGSEDSPSGGLSGGGDVPFRDVWDLRTPPFPDRASPRVMTPEERTRRAVGLLSLAAMSEPDLAAMGAPEPEPEARGDARDGL